MNKYSFSYLFGGYSLLFLISLILFQLAREYQEILRGLLILIFLILLIILILIAITDNKQAQKLYYLGLFILSLGAVLSWSQ